MKARIIRPKTEHEKLCTISSPDRIRIRTECDLPVSVCDKGHCKRYPQMSKELKGKGSKNAR